MKRIPRVKSVMTPFPYSISVDEPLEKAQRIMEEHGFRHLPVIDGDDLVGVLSERLVRLAMEKARASSQQPSVNDIPVHDTYVVGLEEPLDNVVLAMAQRRVNSALVVKDGRLAGIFTSTDACRHLGEFLRAQFPGTGDDEVA